MRKAQFRIDPQHRLEDLRTQGSGLQVPAWTTKWSQRRYFLAAPSQQGFHPSMSRQQPCVLTCSNVLADTPLNEAARWMPLNSFQQVVNGIKPGN